MNERDPLGATRDAPTPPTSIDDLTNEWLTAALRSTGTIRPSTMVCSVDAVGVGAGAGLTGSLFRLQIEYDQPGGDAPSAMIAKFATADDGLRATLGGAAGVYAREINFYSLLSHRVPISAPAFYYGACDPATYHAVLLLEDLTGAKFGAEDESCTTQEGEIAVAAIARMHAAWWRSPELESMSWLWQDQSPSPELVEMARDRYPMFCDRFGGIASAHLRPFLEQIAAGVLPRFSDANTLYHGDFSPKNICFKADGTLVAFDWQLAGHGNPAFDLVRFLAASLSDPEPECRMDSLFERYLQALTGAGVRDYPLDALRRDVRAAVALRLARPIAIGGDPGEIDDVRAQTVRRELGDWAALLTDASVEEVYA